jgi:pimeloyl-ACP methyl ester carboxylesterase
MSPTSTLTLQGGELEVLDLPGSDPPILLLHEGLGSVGLWRDFPQALHGATGCRLVAYSRYGHGQSDPPPKPRTPEFMHDEAVEVLPELLKALEIRDPILVGHSDGASIALIYSADHPATGVVAIAPHVFVEQICLTEIRAIKDTYENTELKTAMARHHRDPDAAFYGWNSVWLDPQFKSWDIRPLLHNIDKPLLLIQGTRDQYGTLAQLDEIARRATGKTKRVHLDCQHSPHQEKPRETLQAVVEFVQSCREDQRIADSTTDTIATTRPMIQP